MKEYIRGLRTSLYDKVSCLFGQMPEIFPNL
jgi:hypothetical protein